MSSSTSLSTAAATTASTSQQKPHVQELSIQYLNFKRTQSFANVKSDEIKTLTLQNLISRVMNTYNQTKNGKDAQSPKFEARNRTIKTWMNYQITVYVQIQNGKTGLTLGLEEEGVEDLPTHQGGDFLLFYHRDTPVREIVVLTSGNGYRAVRACIDYKFPLAVTKMLNPERILEVTRRCLIGPDVKETLLHPSGHEFTKTSSMYYLIESMTAEIGKTSSLIQLGTDYPVLSENLQPSTRVKVSTGLVRIQRKIRMDNFPMILDLFSKAVRGEETRTTEGLSEKRDHRFEFLYFLQPAPGSKTKLDKILVSQLFGEYENGKTYSAKIRHRFFDDFLYTSASEIKISQGKSRFLPLRQGAPTIEDVMNFIATDRPDSFLNADKLLATFNDGKLRYKKKDGNFESDELVDFLEGEIRSNGRTYFKIRGMWFKLSTDHHALLQEDFKAVLKKALIPPTGLLPKTWVGTDKRGKITQKAVTDRFHNSNGIQAFMKALNQAKVCYVDENGKVLQKQLLGEILKNKVVHKHRDKIEKIILAGECVPTPSELKKHFPRNCRDLREILKQLKDKRLVIGEDQFVKNPFPYPLKDSEAFKEIYDEFVKFLIQQYDLSMDREDEETYNRSYLYNQSNSNTPFGPDEGYLVFDQICPRGIEPCDVIKYTKDTLYLCHIKETLGQSTRDACSQAVNAAKEFRSALSCYQAESYIEEMWNKAINSKNTEFHNLMKTQLNKLGKDKFLEMFYTRKLVFVYAFLENENQSLQEESGTLSRLTPAIFEKIPQLNDEKDRTKLIEHLKSKGYLDRFERLTGKFYETSNEKFVIEEFAIHKNQIYRCLCQYTSKSNSTLAKLELIRLANELHALGFEFKICPIKKEKGATQSQIALAAHTSADDSGTASSTGDSDDEDDEVSSSDSSASHATSSSSSSSSSSANTTRTDVAFFSLKQIGDVLLPMPKELTTAKTTMVTSSLFNLGQTCYINAALQMIAHHSAFDKTLTHPLIKKASENANQFLSRQHLQRQTCAIVDQMRKGESVTQKNLEIFFRLLQFCGWNCNISQQQDVQEFILFLREQLEDRVEMVSQLHVISYTYNNTPHSLPSTEFKTELLVGLQTITNIKGKKPNQSLLEMIMKRLQPENLDAYNHVVNGVKHPVQATRTDYIVGPSPNIIFIHALRFRYDLHKASTVRIEEDIPLTTILELPFLNAQALDAAPQVEKYELKTILCHNGGSSANSGHYTAIVRQKYKDPQWHDSKEVFMTYNDANKPLYNIKKADIENTIKLQGYYLSYERV